MSNILEQRAEVRKSLAKQIDALIVDMCDEQEVSLQMLGLSFDDNYRERQIVHSLLTPQSVDGPRPYPLKFAYIGDFPGRSEVIERLAASIERVVTRCPLIFFYEDLGWPANGLGLTEHVKKCLFPKRAPEVCKAKEQPEEMPLCAVKDYPGYCDVQLPLGANEDVWSPEQRSMAAIVRDDVTKAIARFVHTEMQYLAARYTLIQNYKESK